ncbi:MAG: sialidase family protein [Caldilineaceae bacterium]
MKKQNSLRYLVLALIFASIFSLNSMPGLAQAINRWPPPQRIPNFVDDTNPPYLIADQNGTVHAFTSQRIGDDGKEVAIIYNQWTSQKGWTKPIDVILSPLKDQARLLGAFLDQKGMMHIIFFGGDETEANIYYTKAAAVQAKQTQAWLAPLAIGKNALVPETGAIAGDNQGHLIVVYGGDADGKGLYFITSADGGDTWTDPTPFFFTFSEYVWPTSLQMYLGQSGWLHVVWNIDDKTGQGRGVYYAHLKVGETEWSEPFVLAKVDAGLGTKTPTIIEHKDTVFALFYNANTGGHLTFRRSTDEGVSWSEPITPFPQIGMNGAGSFVVDSNQELHLFFGQRLTGEPDFHGMWHSLLRGGNWVAPEPVVSGPRVTDETGDTSFDPIEAKAVDSQGNLLLVTWRTDYCCKANGVWYSYKALNAPQLPLIPLPVQFTLAATLTVPTAIPVDLTATPTVSPVSEQLNNTPFKSVGGPTISLIMGIGPAILFVSIVAAYRFSRYRRF